MKNRHNIVLLEKGYTLVELLVTILIVVVLSTTLGVLFVNLLTLQEQEREEAYIREHIVGLAGDLADNMSVGSSVTNQSDVIYPAETGGVSLETGRVVRAIQLKLKIIEDDSISSRGDMVRRNIWAYENGAVNTNKYLHTFHGDDTPLIILNRLKELEIIDNKIDLSYSFVPLNVVAEVNAALWKLNVIAEYGIKNRKGKEKWKIDAARWNMRGEREDPVMVERVVRLWNHE